MRGFIAAICLACFGAAAGLASPPAGGGTDPAWPSVKLGGFMRSGGVSMALLNGKVLGVGEKISGVEVVSIEAGCVTLGYMGQTRTLRQGQTTDSVEPAVQIPPPPAAPAASSGTTQAPDAAQRSAWADGLKAWADALPPQPQTAETRPEPAHAQTPAPVTTQTATKGNAPAARPRSLEEQVIAEHLQQNPDLGDRLRAQARQRMAENEALLKNPAVAQTGGIFFPQNRAASSPLRLERDNLAAHVNLLAHLERQAGRELTLADVTADNPDASMYVMGLFARGTVQALRRDGLEAGLRFACDFIAAYDEKHEELCRAWTPATVNAYRVEMCWMAAGALERAGDVTGARLTYRSALAENVEHPLVPSLRYMDARAARHAGQAFDATEILRALIEDPKSKNLPLRLPDEAAERDTVYAESVALLEAIRRDKGQAAPPATPPWKTPLSVTPRRKPPAAGEEPAPPPRFGQSHVCKLLRGIDMEFIWIEPMRLWAAKYELTEDQYYSLLSASETGGRLPRNISYEQAGEFCAMLNQRQARSLPDGYEYRIPTVAEWERLARCGTGRVYPWGNTMPPTVGNYSDASVLKNVREQGLADHYAPPIIAEYDDGFAQVAPVEASGRNEWGLFGVGGNVWEWATAPDGESVVKGGTWLHTGDMLRVDAGIPGIHNATAPGGGTLRCVLAPKRSGGAPGPQPEPRR